MLNNIINDIKLIFNNKFIYDKYDINDIICYLIILKHKCDIGIYNIDEEINKSITEDIRIPRLFKYEEFNINSLLYKYKDINPKDLLLEFINTNKKDLLNTSKNVFFYKIDERRNLFYYDITGKVIYVDRFHYRLFNEFDEILNIERKYTRLEDIDNIDTLYIFDYEPRYLLNKNNNIYDLIRKTLLKANNIFLITTYNKVSSFTKGRYFAENIKYIIIDDDNTYIAFTKEDNTSISIINYNHDKITSNDKLLSIINNNKKQKDILVKITTEEFKNNNCRIGFNLYQLENKKELQDINNIIDKNTRLFERLDLLDKRVQEEINNLLNK